jgi:transposase
LEEVSHPKFVKAIKGKKTDKKDAQWIADLSSTLFAAAKDIRRYSFVLHTAPALFPTSLMTCSVMCSVRAHPPSRHVEHPQFDVAPFVDGRCKTPIAQIQEAVDGIFTYEQAEKLKIIRGHMDSP